jgi:hypothetical protein
MRPNTYSVARAMKHWGGFLLSLGGVPELSMSLWAHNLLEIRAGEGRGSCYGTTGMFIWPKQPLLGAPVFTKRRGIPLYTINKLALSYTTPLILLHTPPPIPQLAHSFQHSCVSSCEGIDLSLWHGCGARLAVLHLEVLEKLLQVVLLAERVSPRGCPLYLDPETQVSFVMWDFVSLFHGLD